MSCRLVTAFFPVVTLAVWQLSLSVRVCSRSRTSFALLKSRAEEFFHTYPSRSLYMKTKNGSHICKSPTSPHLNDPDAFTLIFAHASGFHKEHFEPTIEDLCALLRESQPGVPKIHEAGSIDCSNHGDAVVLNEEILCWGYEPISARAAFMHFSLAWAAVSTSISALSVDVDFSTRRLVLFGHSFSTVAQVLALTFEPQLKREAFILLEMTCVAPDNAEAVREYFLRSCFTRRDVWLSTEEEYAMLKSRPTWATWDERVLQIYVFQKHGPQSLPTMEYPDKEGVTLKYTQKQEAVS
ncbi:hypothetical protein DFH08DRAFT_1008002 [Mycena albidolilacea]|uniref:Uncharacterized protein n=1 Tax=Mycena albidolilacea TaxID=1033008 RepID=A0AAD6ZZS7_9AGAR|nr:hypothetical protein DFH08DRAFT_1008002 [Mycena albidolilacea]